MLFNSFVFLFAYLPVGLVTTFAVARWAPTAAPAWLALASLVFYGWWNVSAVPVLLASIAFNFAIAAGIVRSAGRRRAWLLAAGVSGNLAALSYFKYARFLASNWDALLGTSTPIASTALPLGISFFTFTQIAFLVDLYRQEARLPGIARYGLFVTFFPHLIAGPLYHHAQVMPQFERQGAFRFEARDFWLGVDLLVIGLFKKCVLADHLAPFADQVFDGAAKGVAPAAWPAYAAMLCYAFQIYFDFSGYSDMAMGLARMLGIRLPANFESPYRATSIVDFWRRWHMTLSAFLRDYLYIPLGGNRHGRMRRYANLLATMALGGLWHGAAWTFVLWGVAHGAMLCVNHLWNALFGTRAAGRVRRFAAAALTFAAVTLAWVLFRAADIPSAVAIYRAAFGLGTPGGYVPDEVCAWLLLAAVVAWTFPVSWVAVEEWHERAPRAAWRAPLAGLSVGALAFAALNTMFHGAPSPFLYFNF